MSRTDIHASVLASAPSVRSRLTSLASSVLAQADEDVTRSLHYVTTTTGSTILVDECAFEAASPPSSGETKPTTAAVPGEEAQEPSH